MTLTPSMTAGPPLVYSRHDVVPPVGQFPGPHHLPGGIVDHCQPADPAARVELHAEGLQLRLWDRPLEDQGERVASPDRRLPLG